MTPEEGWELVVNGERVPGFDTLTACLREMARLDRRDELADISVRRIDYQRRHG